MRHLKKLINLFCLTTIAVVASSALAQNRGSSAPYISGDTFRSYADFIFDETNIPFFPERVRPGNTIFVKTDYLKYFFRRMRPLINCPYILITHNSDLPAPGNYTQLLEDKNLIAWFGQNVEHYSHPKLHPIPIGIANKYWGHGNTDLLDIARSHANQLYRSNLLFLNFSVGTHPERTNVYHQFINQPFCLYKTNQNYREYLDSTASCKFVLSPRGNGIDCHRTWEALYLGAIPVVKTSFLDPLYENLPVVIVKDWAEVTEEFLNKKYAEMQNLTYQTEKIYADYWFKLIDSYKNQ
ncbi:MAG TPA: hypothetical protein VLG49_00420 [Rhabdochlamydiaceae bacterium]|nr:hypothetical protein [Rhabdochlamydiaceae bacterium]